MLLQKEDEQIRKEILTLREELRNRDELIKQLQIKIGKQQKQIQLSADAGLCVEQLKGINQAATKVGDLADRCSSILLGMGAGLIIFTIAYTYIRIHLL